MNMSTVNIYTDGIKRNFEYCGRAAYNTNKAYICRLWEKGELILSEKVYLDGYNLNIRDGFIRD